MICLNRCFLYVDHTSTAWQKKTNYQLLLYISSLPTCFPLGSSTQYLTWPSLLRVCLHMLVHNSSSPPTLTLASFVPLAFIPWSFSLLVLSVLHSDFFHCQVQLCELCYTETHTKIQTPKWNQAEPPSRSMSRFLAKQYMAILPPCDWRTAGTEWQSHRHRIPLKEQMLASSWHMPLR